MESNNLLTLVIISVTINASLFTLFYKILFKKAKNIIINKKDISDNKIILMNTLNRQTLCVEQLFSRIVDVENMIERLATSIDDDKKNLIQRSRYLVQSKNNNIFKNVLELKLFSNDERDQLSAYNKLISIGDMYSLELMNLKIKTEKNSKQKKIYKSYSKRFMTNINNKIKT